MSFLRYCQGQMILHQTSTLAEVRKKLVKFLTHLKNNMKRCSSLNRKTNLLNRKI